MLIAWEYDFNNWKERFIEYLETNGIKPSTAKDYARRIEKILEEENIIIQKLYVEIDQWIMEYKTGKYAGINKTRHYAPSSALIKFKDFAPVLRKMPTTQEQETMDVYTEIRRTDIIY